MPEQELLRLGPDAVELLADRHPLPVVEPEVAHDALLPLVLFGVGISGRTER